jgi:hypothetical protein
LALSIAPVFSEHALVWAIRSWLLQKNTEVAALPLPLDLLERVDRWANAQADRPSREEAVRRLLLMALGQPTTAGDTIASEDLNASNDE